MNPRHIAPLGKEVVCPRCGSDCQLEEMKYPSESDPTYEFEFTCDKPFDERNPKNDCATWFRVKTDENFQPLGLVEVGMFYQGAQQYYHVPWVKVRKTRQSGRFKPCSL